MEESIDEDKTEDQTSFANYLSMLDDQFSDFRFGVRCEHALNKRTIFGVRCAADRGGTERSVPFHLLFLATLSEFLRQNFPHHSSMHVRQAEVAAAVTVGEAGVVEAEEVEEGGVEVMDVDFVFDRFVAELVGVAEGLAPLYPAAGQPHGEAAAVVVAALGPFGPGGAAEFPPPDDERFVEQAAALEVGQ